MAWLRALFLLVLLTSTAFADGENAVLGDASWRARFGVAPEEAADEETRLRVHLEYVEAVLRARDTSGLTDDQRAARAHNLDLLRAYIARGEFPRNHDVPGRRPHFIDEDGRICAVGYLIERTAGRAAAEAINRAHEWDFLDDIRGIDAWVDASGLTREELAMIQPSYNWRPRPVPPPEEGAMQRRTIIATLSGAQPAVRRCAAWFDTWNDRVGVSVIVHAGRASVSVEHGGRRFRNCVQRTLELRLREIRPQLAMTVPFTFDLERRGGFAQPPPR